MRRSFGKDLLAKLAGSSTPAKGGKRSVSESLREGRRGAYLIALSSSCGDENVSKKENGEEKGGTHVNFVGSVNRNIDSRELINIPEVQTSLDDELL